MIDKQVNCDISAHGTFIGNYRIEANKPTQLPVDSTFRFGESTRKYIMRERPKVCMNKIIHIKWIIYRT